MDSLPIVMVNQPLQNVGNIALRSECTPVRIDDPEHMKHARLVIRELFRSLYSEPSGVAIAAPQIGIQLKIAAIDFFDNEAKSRRVLALINPVISESSSEEIEEEEICLSVPNFSGKVLRSKSIRVEAYGPNGDPVEVTAEGYFARVLQHEIDHLNGILYIDRVKSELVPVPDFPDRKLPGTMRRLRIE